MKKDYTYIYIYNKIHKENTIKNKKMNQIRSDLLKSFFYLNLSSSKSFHSEIKNKRNHTFIQYFN